MMQMRLLLSSTQDIVFGETCNRSLCASKLFGRHCMLLVTKAFSDINRFLELPQRSYFLRILVDSICELDVRFTKRVKHEL